MTNPGETGAQPAPKGMRELSGKEDRVVTKLWKARSTKEATPKRRNLSGKMTEARRICVPLFK